jgi:hypothetical protein
VYCSPLAKRGTRRLLSAATPRAAALLAVATDARMYAINNDEVKQTANNYIEGRHAPALGV